jgi:hypothetical protein
VERLEAQVAGLAEESKSSKDAMSGLQVQVGQFTGALKRFLGQIRIDEGLKLVRNDRALPPPPLQVGRFPGATIGEMDVGGLTEAESEFPNIADFRLDGVKPP